MHIFIDDSDLGEYVVGCTVPYATDHLHELISRGYIFFLYYPIFIQSHHLTSNPFALVVHFSRGYTNIHYN